MSSTVPMAIAIALSLSMACDFAHSAERGETLKPLTFDVSGTRFEVPVPSRPPRPGRILSQSISAYDAEAIVDMEHQKTLYDQLWESQSAVPGKRPRSVAIAIRLHRAPGKLSLRCEGEMRRIIERYLAYRTRIYDQMHVPTPHEERQTHRLIDASAKLDGRPAVRFASSGTFDESDHYAMPIGDRHYIVFEFTFYPAERMTAGGERTQEDAKWRAEVDRLARRIVGNIEISGAKPGIASCAESGIPPD